MVFLYDEYTLNRIGNLLYKLPNHTFYIANFILLKEVHCWLYIYILPIYY